jgi:hypothetical protein
MDDLHTMSNTILPQRSKCFSANKLALILIKQIQPKFIMKNSPEYTLCIGYKEKYVESLNMKFLGL